MCRRSINRQLSKDTSTLCYCTSLAPSRRGGIGATVLTMLPPSLPSRWIKSPGGSQIKSFKVFFQDLPGKKTSRDFIQLRQANFSKYCNNTVYWHPCSLEPLYTRHREPLQYNNSQTDKQTIINYSWKTQGIVIKNYQKIGPYWQMKYWKFQVVQSITWNFTGWYWSWVCP